MQSLIAIELIKFFGSIKCHLDLKQGLLEKLISRVLCGTYLQNLSNLKFQIFILFWGQTEIIFQIFKLIILKTAKILLKWFMIVKIKFLI